LELDFLSDDRMALYLRAADLVVLPYRAIQNSGSAILALSADRPIVVPALGAMSELAAQVGDEWVHTYSGEFSAEVLTESLGWLKSRDRARSPDLSDLDWHRIALLTMAAYEAVISRPRPQARRRRHLNHVMTKTRARLRIGSGRRKPFSAVPPSAFVRQSSR
jgi:hypothetical protein